MSLPTKWLGVSNPPTDTRTMFQSVQLQIANSACCSCCLVIVLVEILNTENRRAPDMFFNELHFGLYQGAG